MDEDSVEIRSERGRDDREDPLKGRAPGDKTRDSLWSGASEEGALPAMSRRIAVLFSRNGRGAVTLEERYLLARQLHVLQKSGVPILSSLKALETQLPSASLKRILREMHQDLLEGRTLSQALARHPKAFGPVELGLIRVGEAGGLLDDTLLQLAHLLEWEMEMRNQLKQAFQYPVIVLGTLAFAMTVMVVFVLPRFARMFQSLHIELPLQTRLLMALSYVISHFGWLMVLLVIGAAAGWLLYLGTEAGRLRWHRWKLRLPLLGPVCVELAMSRFARVIAALNRGGVPILETLALAGQSVNNRYVQQVIGRVRNRVEGGDNLANALRREPLFPPVVVQMVATGEEAGRLDELLQSVSDYYDQQVRYFVKKLVTYLEPALLVVVGIGVLVMATAVLVPMWDLVKVFKR